MLPAIDFNDDAVTMTSEIKDIGTEGNLAAKAEPVEPVRSQGVPKFSFGGSQRASE
jgi:hypothetical protein